EWRRPAAAPAAVLLGPDRSPTAPDLIGASATQARACRPLAIVGRVRPRRRCGPLRRVVVVVHLLRRGLDDALPWPQPHVDEHVTVDQVDLGDLLVDHLPTELVLEFR